MIIRDFSFGRLFSDQNILCFFGNRNANINQLQSAFPEVSFTRIKQVHGNKVVESIPGQDLIQEADAHTSEYVGHGLCSVSADCAPILIHCNLTKRIAAIHAGWRGVASRITVHTIQDMQKSGSTAKSLKMFIGPHIQMKSFEVGADVHKQILDSCKQDANSLSKPLMDGKFLVDLSGVLLSQIDECSISTEQITYWNQDTLTDLNFHSHRRDKALAGRQISFIARLKI